MTRARRRPAQSRCGDMLRASRGGSCVLNTRSRCGRARQCFGWPRYVADRARARRRPRSARSPRSMHCAVTPRPRTGIFGSRTRSRRACGCTGGAALQLGLLGRASSCSPGRWPCAATARPAALSVAARVRRRVSPRALRACSSSCSGRSRSPSADRQHCAPLLTRRRPRHSSARPHRVAGARARAAARSTPLGARRRGAAAPAP